MTRLLERYDDDDDDDDDDLVRRYSVLLDTVGYGLDFIF